MALRPHVLYGCWCGVDHSKSPDVSGEELNDRYTIVVASTVRQARLVAQRERLTRWKPATRPDHLHGYGPECRFIQVEPPLTDHSSFYEMLAALRRLEGRGATIEMAYDMTAPCS